MNVYLSTSGKINENILSQMRYGDIIVVFDNNKIQWGIIDGCIQDYQLRVFITAETNNIPQFNDKFIFSYDAINNRTGDKEAILYLIHVFSNINIQSFLNNLLNILLFKEDRIDSNTYASLFSDVKCYRELTKYHIEQINTTLNEVPITTSKTAVNLPQAIKKEIAKHIPEAYLFYDYLNPKCQELWHQYYNYNNYNMRDIFNIIRKVYPQFFTLALKEYNTKHEHGNIYFLKSNRNVNVLTE